MNITRHNYEEYFILYLDNELSSDERRMVEAFVQLHPDLKEELDILSQYKITPDTNITYSGKEELMKTSGENSLLPASFEEQLLLYIDNELPDTSRKEVEQLLATHSTARQQLELLQITKLQPDNIPFPDKKLLYRKEDKVRRLPYIRWAAAAILLFTIGLSVYIIFNNKTTSNSDLVNNGDDKKLVPISPIGVNTPGKQVATIPLQNLPGTTTATPPDNKQELVPANKPSNIDVVVTKNQPAINKNIPGNSSLPIKNNEPAIVVNKPNNNLPQPLYNPASNNIAPKDAVVKNTTSDEMNKTKPSLTNPVVTTIQPQPLDIVNASFTDEGGTKKSKLRGIFRKVSRTFEKRTDIIEATNGGDRLLIAGLSFKVK